MIFNIEWVIQNPVQSIDSGVKVLFDSEPILVAITIVTFLVVAFFVWKKNEVRLYRHVRERKSMEPVRIDREDLLELKSALGKATSEESASPAEFSEPSAKGRPPKEQTKTSGEAAKGTMAIPSRTLDADIRPSDPAKVDEPPDELIDWFVGQYTDDGEEKKAMRRPPEIDGVGDEVDNKQHSYEEPKIDKRKTPEFKAKLLENLRKARERKNAQKRNAKKMESGEEGKG